MSLLRSLTLTLLVAATVAGAFAFRPRAVKPSAADDGAADAPRRLEELQAAAAQVEAVERRKKELEAQVDQLERLRAGTTTRALVALDETARSLSIEMRQITLNEGRLEVSFKARSAADAQRFRQRLEERGIVAGVSVEPREAKTFVLTATLSARASSAPLS